MPARQPGVFIDHCRHQVGNLGIAALPQRTERARRADDRQIMDVMLRRDFCELVGHARAAGNAGDKAGAVFKDAFEDLLRTAHFPQHVDVDRALAARDFVRALDLFGAALDAVADQLFEAFDAGRLRVDLRDRVAVLVIAVGIDRADSTDAASSSPGAGAHVIGGGNTLAAFDERPDFLAAVADRLETLETHIFYAFSFLAGCEAPASIAARSPRQRSISPGAGLVAAALNCA